MQESDVTMNVIKEVGVFPRSMKCFHIVYLVGPQSLTVMCCHGPLQEWISRFIVPAVIITEQVMHFQFALFLELAKLSGIKWQRTTIYRPQSMRGWNFGIGR